MKILTIILSITLISTNGMAQAGMSEHDMAQMSKQSTSPVKHEGHGIIKAVKKNKVQLEHEAITTLNWSAMTMWFPLRDPLPAELKVGDKVRFELEQSEANKWLISKIEIQPTGK
jgi:Cu/Ag efflux protein CusF